MQNRYFDFLISLHLCKQLRSMKMKLKSNLKRVEKLPNMNFSKNNLFLQMCTKIYVKRKKEEQYQLNVSTAWCHFKKNLQKRNRK